MTDAHDDQEVGVAELVDVLVDVRVNDADRGWGESIVVGVLLGVFAETIGLEESLVLRNTLGNWVTRKVSLITLPPFSEGML